MRIGIIGGTGGIGEGMAMRLSQFHEVLLGSRDAARAGATSRECRLEVERRGRPCSLESGTNRDAAEFGELAIVALRFEHLISTLGSLPGLEGRVVISPVNPITRGEFFSSTRPPEGSAASLVQRLLPGSRVVAAFNAIASNRWRALDEPLKDSVPVCADDPAAKATVMGLIEDVPRLRAHDAGPLAAASMVECLAPLLLNVGRYDRMPDAGIQFR